MDALARMHREASAILRHMLLEQPGRQGPDYLLVRAAWQAGEALGVKLASIFPGNQEICLPLVSGAYLLFRLCLTSKWIINGCSLLLHEKVVGPFRFIAYLTSLIDVPKTLPN